MYAWFLVGLAVGDWPTLTGLQDGDLDLTIRAPCRAMRPLAVPGAWKSPWGSSWDFDR